MGRARVVCIGARDLFASYVDSRDSSISQTDIVASASSVATNPVGKSSFHPCCTEGREAFRGLKIAVASRTTNPVTANARYVSARRRPVTMLLAVIAFLAAGSNAEVFTNTFLVKMRQPAERHIADRVAARNGFINLGPVLGSQTEYHFLHRALPHARSKRSVPHTRKLKVDPLVHTAVQQQGFKRVKRGYKPLSVDNLVPFYQTKDSEYAGNREPTDPYFQYQWYLKNTGQNGGKPKLDLNVEAAWAQGVTGKNVTTAIMDDGVDYMHPDLKYNYNARASYDFSSNDPYPYPRYTDDWFNSHGTRCAGEVAAARDNGVCGVGVAYDSKIAGIRMLDQPYMTDLIEANSMGHEPDLIDIYSASWGPTDDGKTVDGPRNATMRAIVRGVNEGRRGLGNIYVWASGDGGEEDDCNCDGYAASMWTVSINSAINDGQNAHYDESCSSTLASTFSNGAKDPKIGVATTDLYGKCTRTHSGTSAAAPEAAGVFALALEANPMLTWRDIQHLTVLTSKRNSLFDAKGRFQWKMNGVGLEFNHLFGFGVLDAGAMVALAKKWKTVPPRNHCEARGNVFEPMKVTSDEPILLKIETDACAGTEYAVNYLEHVQAVISVNATRRGDLQLFLTSPMGTRSMILSRRINDDDHRDGFTKWPFMTTHTWGEYPQGTWLLEVRFDTLKPQRGWFREWTLMLHGTREAPYTGLAAADPHSKLAIVKKAHEERLSAM
ncbi:prohormone processing protease amontillado [Nomia melanderi]|uniref:prohormone processing protease amontillado n=1 Tax=Nomia melanderi TaxID=2448451 RepID=UPI0013044316|nr:neuroendocrine convertase 2 [Nomia melanderi]XP_031845674.1 neuroendocrine convertase 2 [Nomia melanderi]